MGEVTDFDYPKYRCEGDNQFRTYLCNNDGSHLWSFHAVIEINSADNITIKKGNRWDTVFYPDFDNTTAK